MSAPSLIFFRSWKTASPKRVSLWPMMTAAPISPGTAPPVYQPAVIPSSAGGTSTVPSVLRPNSISELVIPTEGTATSAGGAGAAAAGRSDFGAPDAAAGAGGGGPARGTGAGREPGGPPARG